MTRAATFRLPSKKDVDGRVKPGHDGESFNVEPSSSVQIISPHREIHHGTKIFQEGIRRRRKSDEET
jgi:hypothetical protein